MQLNIKNEATVKLAHEVAKRYDETLVQSVHKSLELRMERAPKLKPELTREEKIERIRAIQERVAKRPVLDARPHGEMLYDEFGNPNDNGH